MRVPSRPDASMYWPIHCLASTRSSLLRWMQIDVPRCLERSGDPDLSHQTRLWADQVGAKVPAHPADALQQVIRLTPLSRPGTPRDMASLTRGTNDHVRLRAKSRRRRDWRSLKNLVRLGASHYDRENLPCPGRPCRRGSHR